MLIFFTRVEDQRRPVFADQVREFLRQILAAVFGFGHQRFVGRRAIETRIRRSIRMSSFRPVAACQPIEALIGKTQERRGVAVEAERRERGARFLLAPPTVTAKILRLERDVALFQPNAVAVAVAIREEYTTRTWPPAA